MSSSFISAVSHQGYNPVSLVAESSSLITPMLPDLILFPKEDREPVIKQYSPAIVLAEQPNFGYEIREDLDLLFDNCIDFKLFQCYMSPELPEHITTRGKYIMHLIGQHINVQYDEVARVSTYQKGDYIVTTLIRDEPLF